MFSIKPSSKSVRTKSIIHPHKDSNLISATVRLKTGRLTRMISRNELDLFKSMWGEDNCFFKVAR